jgi:hypothetical protein
MESEEKTIFELGKTSEYKTQARTNERIERKIGGRE